jgi:hypothetical protein
VVWVTMMLAECVPWWHTCGSRWLDLWLAKRRTVLLHQVAAPSPAAGSNDQKHGLSGAVRVPSVSTVRRPTPPRSAACYLDRLGACMSSASTEPG